MMAEQEQEPYRPYAAALRRRGQRRKPTKSPFVQVNLVLTEEQRDWLDALAVEYQQSRSDVARALFAGLMKKQARQKANKA